MRPGAGLLGAAGVDAVVDAVPGSSRAILDLSCGDGALGAALKSRARQLGRACRVTGVEAYPDLAVLARERLDEVVVGNPERIALPFLPGSFDAVVALGVFDVLVRPEAMMQLVRTYLRPRGRLVAAGPEPDRLRELVEGAGLVPAGSGSTLTVAERSVTPDDFTEVVPLSVVVPVHDQVSGLARLLAGVLASAGRDGSAPVRVVVVDNDSSDRAAALSTSDTGNVMVLHRRDENTVAGLAEGIEAARSRVLCFLSPEMEVGDDFVRAVRETFQRDHNVAAVVPLVLVSGGTTGSGNQVSRNDILSLDACSVRWNAYQMVGGFDPTLDLDAAGADFTQRLRRAGWLVIHDPAVRVVRHARS